MGTSLERIGAVQRADNPASHGKAEAVGIAKGEHGLSRVQAEESPNGMLGRLVASTLMTARSVRGSVPTVSPQNAAVAEGHFDLGRALDHVIVGDDVAVRRDDDAAADAMFDLRWWSSGWLKNGLLAQHGRNALRAVAALAVRHIGLAV